MKTLKLSKMTGVAAMLFISLVAVFMLQFSNVEKSYADEDPATEQQEVATQDDNFDFWSWLCGTNETDENTTEFIAQNANYANAEPYNPLAKDHFQFLVQNAEEENYCRVFAVKNGLFNSCKISCKDKDGNPTDFIFEYNYHGWIGEYDGPYDVHSPHIQYFVNTKTEEMALLRTGIKKIVHGDDISINPKYNGTKNECGIDEGITFNTEWKFKHAANITFGKHIKRLYIDPDIDFIGGWSLQDLIKCEFVDICNHCYQNCNLWNLKESCFRCLGKDSKWQTFVPFLRALSDEDRKELLNDKDWWCKKADIGYNDTVYQDYNTYSWDAGVKQVLNIWGNNVENGEYRSYWTNPYYIDIKLNSNFNIASITDNGTELSYECLSDCYRVNLSKNISRHNIKINTQESQERKDMDVHGVARIFDTNLGQYIPIAQATNVDFVENNGTVHKSALWLPWSTFSLKIRSGIVGRLRFYNDDFDYRTSEMLVSSETCSGQLWINIDKANLYNVGGEVRLNTSNSIGCLDGAIIEFIEDNRIWHETKLDKAGLFRFRLPLGVKGKFHVCTDEIESDYIDYTVIGDDFNINIDCHKHQKYPTYTLSGKVIYGDMSTCKVINVDLICDTGKVIHKEYWPSHMSDQINFNFDNIVFGSKVKIHVYTENGISKQTDQFTVNSNMQLDPINIS